ncbi:MAG TPA: DUF4124 domain-containing protein [Steroidobacteraceae bacterium]|nr:DUF4124 domain-containing protein [Steroidobacteraceae bacterium]
MLRLPAVSVALALAAFAVDSAGAASNGARNPEKKGDVTYKWVDEKGITHYGDYVPPEYAKRERAVLNEEGVVIRKLEAEKSPEQRAAEALRLRDTEARKQHDQFLLNTYTSVDDIETLRDQRLEQIVGQSAAATQYVESLNSRLTGLQAKAQLFKPYSSEGGARRMPDDLAADLVRTVSELRMQNNVLLAKQREHADVSQQFQVDIERFAELQSGRAQR